MAQVFLSLGANLGDTKVALQGAVEAIEKVARLIKSSGFYETEPWGNPDQLWFLNAVVEIETDLEPLPLLHAIKEIEKKLGRKPRFESNAPREIDIDILFYDNLVFESDTLQIPHPHIADRLFTLTMLNEIAPNFLHPILKKNIAILLNECEDSSIVRPANGHKSAKKTRDTV
ncbi:MAG: 2-amino-4-hydroxy-6-hydroxymethyldihydropteridine diphosphokinase [Patescibacteria group bacterium]